jgi:hypothetical protein
LAIRAIRAVALSLIASSFISSLLVRLLVHGRSENDETRMAMRVERRLHPVGKICKAGRPDRLLQVVQLDRSLTRSGSPDHVPERVAHHLDGLLRHRLLPQPGGFEGVLELLIETGPHDRAVADRPDPDAASLDLDSIATPRHVRKRHRHVLSCVDQLVGTDREGCFRDVRSAAASL